MKILIAEDDTVSRIILSTHLQKCGHQVILAENGEQAYRLYLEEHPNILIVDWMMPKVDGLQLCRMVRAEKTARYTYIIMLSALNGKGSYLEGMQAGADDFMSKPFDTDTFNARLHVAERILNLQYEITQLEGLLPICSYCKNIRDEQNIWVQLEAYISERTETTFSHGICPECYDTHVRPELERLKKEGAFANT